LFHTFTPYIFVPLAQGMAAVGPKVLANFLDTHPEQFFSDKNCSFSL